MKDYSDIGLIRGLKSARGIANKQSEFSSGYKFSEQFEDSLISQRKLGSAVVGNVNIIDASINNAKLGTAVIGTANIGTLSFNEITGGTCILGGASNGSGLLEVFDASGAVKIAKIGNTGYVALSQAVRFGSPDGEQAFVGFSAANSRLQIESLGYSIRLATDDGDIQLLASGENVEVTIGTASTKTFRVKTSAGTIMELDPNGNLNIAGELGTGVSF